MAARMTRAALLVLGVLALSVAALAGGCEDSSYKNGQAVLSPTATGVAAVSTITRVIPTPAADVGRTDCPKDWAGYRDPDGRFSLCYPIGWTAVTAPPDADFGTTFSLRTAESVSFTLYWKPSGYFDSPDFQDRCRIVSWEGAEQTTLTIADRTVAGCVGYETLHATDAPPLRSTFAEIPLRPAEGYLVFFSTTPEGLAYADANNVIAAIIDSLRFGS